MPDAPARWLQTTPNDGKASEKYVREGAWKSIRAWNAWRRSEHITRLVYKEGAPIPRAEP